MVNQAGNSDGVLVGGVLGFLRTLKYLVTSIRPTKVFVVWEQGGGCPRRKHLYPQYKENRLKQKDFKELYDENGKIHPAADKENKVFQIEILTSILSCLPVCQLYTPNTECDDIIAWLCKGYFKASPEKKVIISSDKDFFQLLEDKNVEIFDIGKKHYVNEAYVKETFKISPKNITLARCIAGDESDNISGISGIGLKTISKRFDLFLSSDIDIDTDMLLKLAKEFRNASKKPPKCYQDIIDGEETIRRNWQLMFLDIGNLSSGQIEKLTYRIEEFKPNIKKMDYYKIIAKANMQITKDLDEIIYELKYLLHNE
jgi:5'-3' exonuclease